MGSVGEFSKVCSQIVLKCLYLARSGRPDILWSVNNLLVLSLTGRACDKTSSTFDQIHLSRMRIETILSCWKYSTTMQIRIVSGFLFCRRSRRLNINIRETLVYFWKPHVRANELDVQETDFSFTQLYRS